MSEYIRQRRCDGNAGLASIRERRMQRGGPGLFSGKRARGFTTRGTQGQKIRTCSYGRPLYESYILKTQEKVAPIFSSELKEQAGGRGGLSVVKIKIDDSKSSSRCLRYSSSSCNWRLRETRILRQRAQEHRVRGPSLGDSQRTVFSPGYPTESTGGSSTGWRERLLCSVMRNLKKWMVQYFSA